MDPKLQSSFIPKRPITEGPAIRASSTVNIFFLLSLIVFLITLAAGAFLFFFNQRQVSVIKDKGAQLETIRKDFSDSLTRELTRLDLRLITANTILSNHMAVSSVFKLLQALTAKNVRFTRFDFTVRGPNLVALTLAGEGRSFNAVSFQSDLFRNNQSMIAPLFSDIRLDDRGSVLFNVETKLDPAVVLYKNLFSGQSNSTN